ncbi:hypothetical protein pb186bvf_014398 [Paramecium bursaria]
MSLGVDFERYQFDKRLKELQDKVLTLNHRQPNPPQYQQQQPIIYQQPQQQYYPVQYVQSQRDEDSSSDEEPQYQHKRKRIKSYSQIPTQPFVRNDIIQMQSLQHQRMLEQMNQAEQAQNQKLLEYLEQQNKAIISIAQRMKQQQEDLEREREKKQEEEYRQQQLQKMQKMLAKRQEVMMQKMKNDILDSLDYPQNHQQIQQPQIYGNEYFYQPHAYGTPHQYVSQTPFNSQSYHGQPMYPYPMQPVPAPIPVQPQYYPTPSPIRSNLSNVGRQSMNKIDKLLQGI